MSDSYVSADEAGAIYNVSGETLRRLYRSGRIPAYRVGRFLRFSPEELASTFRSSSEATPRATVAPNFDALEAKP